jgi:hypothetical protein
VVAEMGTTYSHEMHLLCLPRRFGAAIRDRSMCASRMKSNYIVTPHRMDDLLNLLMALFPNPDIQSAEGFASSLSLVTFNRVF